MNENDKTFGSKRTGHIAAPLTTRMRADPQRWINFVERMRPVVQAAWFRAAPEDHFYRWRRQQYDKHKVHPVVLAAIAACQPNSLRQILFQWPHVAEDETKLAYTPTPGYLTRDRVLITTPGKYLRQAFSLLPDNSIRDLTALNIESTDRFGIATTMEQMLEVLERGPQSCMSGNASDFQSNPHHPYEVYDPSLGWGLAYEKDTRVQWTGRFRSRCLVHRDESCFVRSFYAGDNYEGYSYASPGLEQWLKDKGYVHAGGWDGFEIKRIETRHGDVVLPYIDGDAQHATRTRKGLEISTCGEYDGTNTDGRATDAEDDDSTNCDDCGDRVSIDATSSVGINSEGNVCQSCMDHNYTYVYGRRRNEYYISSDDALCGNDGRYYDPEYLSDNDMMVTDDDECVCIEDVTCCAHDEVYYITENHSWLSVPDGQVCDDNIEDYMHNNIEHLPLWDDATDHAELMRQFIDAVRDGDITDLNTRDTDALIEYCLYLDEENPLGQAQIDKETVPLPLEEETNETTNEEKEST